MFSLYHSLHHYTALNSCMTKYHSHSVLPLLVCLLLVSSSCLYGLPLLEYPLLVGVSSPCWSVLSSCSLLELTFFLLTCDQQRTLSPEEDMETSSAFSPGNQHQSTATTSIKLIKQITYTPDGHHVAAAAQCRAAHTHSRSSLAIRTSCEPITKPSLKTGHSLSTPTTTEEANGHFLLKPCPSVFNADCFLQPTWDTVVPSESCANTTTSNDKIQGREHPPYHLEHFPKVFYQDLSYLVD